MTTPDWSKIVPSYSIPGAKPRRTGMTMVIDKGLGRAQTGDFIEVSSSYVDLLKVAIGTAPLYPHGALRDKLRNLATAGIRTFPGGTLFEVAWMNQAFEMYLDTLKEAGFTAVEISAGIFDISPSQKSWAIRRAAAADLLVLSEVGKKDPAAQFEPSQVAEAVHRDLEAGADYVVIEARESGTGVGIYDAAGRIRAELVEKVVHLMGPTVPQVLWEAPLANQQAYLINMLGPDVNLGNVRPDDVLGLEALRRHLRWDTLPSSELRSDSAAWG